MRFRVRDLGALPGSLLVMVGAVATLWLAITKQLGLYIHPRYNTFTIVLSAVGLLIAVWATKNAASAKRLHPSALLILLLAVFCLLITKPAVLSSSVANQRGLNSSVTPTDTVTLPDPQTVQLFANNDYSRLSIKDWANLLQQTNDQAFFAGKEAVLTGFITADSSDPEHVFFVSRFVVSCCAVDARPVGVPVYLPDWQRTFRPDQWVSVKGAFATNPSTKGSQRIIVRPAETRPIDKPKDPYVY
jgi:putative membrane protein